MEMLMNLYLPLKELGSISGQWKQKASTLKCYIKVKGNYTLLWTIESVN